MAQAGLALLAGGAAAWFVAVQALVIGRFCAYCTAVHVLGIVVCVVTLSAWGLPSGMTAALAVAGLVALVAGQLLFRPREYVVRSTLPPPAVPGPARPAIKSMEDSPPPSDRRGSRQVEVLGGRVVLTVGDWPRLGPADAPHVIAYLFDYTCATCRNVHRLLLEAIPMSGLDIAVLLVPAPVDPTCNPHVIRRSVTHAHACRYARLGLMVWRANSDRFAEYDRWVFDGGDEPPAIGFARARAEELLGMTDLDPSVPDGDLEQLIAKGVATYRTADSGKMPTLLFPNAVLSGQVPSAERLAEILREQFASP